LSGQWCPPPSPKVWTLLENIQILQKELVFLVDDHALVILTFLSDSVMRAGFVIPVRASIRIEKAYRTGILGDAYDEKERLPFRHKAAI
jgi:hypothetical protein